MPDIRANLCSWIAEHLGDYAPVTIGDEVDRVLDAAKTLGLLVINPADEVTVERVAVWLHENGTEPTGISWATMNIYEPACAQEYRDLARGLLAELGGER